ncbi:MAG: hypothetical protein ACJ72H_15415 [Candidatus Sulfotelmatobacter sp.]
MTDLAAPPGHFWLASTELKGPLRDDVPYTRQALRYDLRRLEVAWEDCQASRQRDAIYGYLASVFDLVAWWATERRALERARQALRLRSIHCRDHDEPFAAIIACTADAGKVDRRTRSKWSRLLRYALKYKPADESLASFIKAAGGINQAVSRFAHQARSEGIGKGRAL